MSRQRKLGYRDGCGIILFTLFFLVQFFGVFMQFKVKSALTVLAAATLLVACGKKEEAAPAAPAAAPAAPAAAVVKIGHVGPTSGAIAHLGKDNENGARMAIEELNAAGVMIDGKKVTLELMAEDDAADPKQGTAVAQKLADAKVAGVVGHLNSGTTIPASKIYSDAGIPQISPSATNPKYTRQGFKTAFRVVADDAQLGGTLGKYAVGTLKGKSIAVIDDRTAYGQGVAEEFTKAVEGAGGKVVAKEFTTDKATDFNSILTTIKGKKPDVVFFGGMDAVAGPMLKQMKSLGIKAKFMGGDGICSTELVKLGGDAIADDQVFCAEAGGVEGEAKAGMDEFKAKFKTKFNADVQVYAPYVYDSVKIMVAAMVKANSSDPAKYLPVLAATADYKGVTGPISFDEKGDIKGGALTLKTVRAGKLETIAVIR
jgi:branched-chain amino acid transport system substrate-binding protein